MATIQIPKIKWGKRKERSQMCDVITIDGRLKEVELPVTRCIEDQDAGMSWHLSPDNLYLGDDGNWYQILDEEFQVPVCPRSPFRINSDEIESAKLLALPEINVLETAGNGHNGSNGSEDLGHITQASAILFGNTYEDKKAEQFQKAGMDDTWNKLLWAISIVSGVILLMFAINKWG